MRTKDDPEQSAPRNRLLALLAPEDRARLLQSAEKVPLETRQVLFDIDRPIDHVYLPESGVVSIVSATTDGTAVESATTGFEGMVGLPVFLGADRASTQAFVQIAGEANRLTADAFREELRRNDALGALLGRYTQAMIAQIARTSACSRLHPMRQRFARWLLESHDRMQADTFALTQEFLAQMLGVRRATVSEVSVALQREGSIRVEYGHITVRDRNQLEREACDCYWIVKREYRRLIEGEDTPSLFGHLTTARDGRTALVTPR